jgi:2-polyprenyl-3-methyl-5-hydroxy-6-metoxy-1,4-benzoquinol methylase
MAFPLGTQGSVFQKKKARGRLPDIGCGNGYFMALCRSKGYEVQGIDVSKWAATYATEALGITVHIGQIDDVELPRGQFDIITMWHSLEHTRNPRYTIEKAKGWLKADGILAIEVPNYEGRDARSYGQDWVAVSVSLLSFYSHVSEEAPSGLRLSRGEE